MTKKIDSLWLEEFIELSKFSKGKYYKILGPLLIGIELIKLPKSKNYRPHFVAYMLFSDIKDQSLKDCLSGPIILHEFFDHRRFQYNLSIEENRNKLDEVFSSIKKQSLISITGDVQFKKLINVMLSYLKKSPLSAAPDSFLYASFLKEILIISICFDAKKDIQNILKKIKSTTWDRQHFKDCGYELNTWLSKIEKLTFRKDDFLNELQQNINNPIFKDMTVSKIYF